MSKKMIENKAVELVLPIVEKNGLELVDVEFVKEGANWYLRIYIYKNGGVTVEDCQVVSEELSGELDRVNPIKQSYILEVSSPGLERPLKKEQDFERYKGETVELKLFKAIDGNKIFTGELLGLVDGKIGIKMDDGIVKNFDRDKVAIVRRSIWKTL